MVIFSNWSITTIHIDHGWTCAIFWKMTSSIHDCSSWSVNKFSLLNITRVPSKQVDCITSTLSPLYDILDSVMFSSFKKSLSLVSRLHGLFGYYWQNVTNHTVNNSQHIHGYVHVTWCGNYASHHLKTVRSVQPDGNVFAFGEIYRECRSVEQLVRCELRTSPTSELSVNDGVVF